MRRKEASDAASFREWASKETGENRHIKKKNVHFRTRGNMVRPKMKDFNLSKKEEVGGKNVTTCEGEAVCSERATLTSCFMQEKGPFLSMKREKAERAEERNCLASAWKGKLEQAFPPLWRKQNGGGKCFHNKGKSGR